MDQIAKDIVFLKDNLEKIDKDTYYSLWRRDKSVEPGQIKLTVKRFICLFIVMFCACCVMEKYQQGVYLEAEILILNVVLSLDFIVGSLPFTYKNYGEYTASAVITSIIMLVLLMKGVFYEPVTTVISGIALGLIVSLIVKLLNRETGVKFNKVPAGQEDALTKQIYEILKKYGVKNEEKQHWMNFDSWRADEKISYPEANPVKAIDIDRKSLLKDILTSQTAKTVISRAAGDDREKIMSLLESNKENLYVQNDVRESYLETIHALMNASPVCFDIKNVAGLDKPVCISIFYDSVYYRWERSYFNVRRFQESVRPLLTSEGFQKLAKLDEIYQQKLQDFQADMKGTVIGAKGERQVLETLEDSVELMGRDKMRVLSNIRLDVNGKSLESDFIVVCLNGVFVLEVKNLGSTGSYNVTVEKDGLWKKVMKNGRWKQMPDSISHQNERHLMGIERVINARLNSSAENRVSANSLIVFANDVVGIKNYSDNVIIRDSEIMTEIRKHPVCLNEKQIAEIADILQSCSLPAKEYRMENWAKELLALHYEIAARAEAIRPEIQPYIDIMTAYAYKTDFKIPFPQYQKQEDVITLSDDEREYQKSDEEIAAEKAAEQRRKGGKNARHDDEEYFIDEQSEEDRMWDEYMSGYQGGGYNMFDPNDDR